MFVHNFKYSFKILLKNRDLIFWTVMWPILLATMFHFAFSNISESEKLDPISLGIVDNLSYQQDTYLVETLQNLSDKKNDSKLFDIVYGSESELTEMLESKEIKAYLIKEETAKIVVKENGIDQTITKHVIDEIYEYGTLVNTLITNELGRENQLDPQLMIQKIIKDIQENKRLTKDISTSNINYIVIEFYTLIAMTALLGATITSTAISNYLANISKRGARTALAPIGRLKLLLGGLLSSFIIQALAMGILLYYTKVILKVDYGDRIDLVVLLSIIGGLAGNSLGLVMGSVTLKNESLREAIIITITMSGSFFAGMMGVGFKYIVDKNMPILNMINPVNMITDGFYALYYYDSLDRYYFNVYSLLLFSGILFVIAYFFMRRKKYDSI